MPAVNGMELRLGNDEVVVVVEEEDPAFALGVAILFELT